jgi:hypothetical protein
MYGTLDIGFGKKNIRERYLKISFFLKLIRKQHIEPVRRIKIHTPIEGTGS